MEQKRSSDARVKFAQVLVGHRFGDDPITKDIEKLRHGLFDPLLRPAANAVTVGIVLLQALLGRAGVVVFNLVARLPEHDILHDVGQGNGAFLREEKGSDLVQPAKGFNSASVRPGPT